MNEREATYTVRADQALGSSPLREIWKYRELLLLLVKRDFISAYKQTVLGPLWFIIQPVASSLIFTIVFGQIVKIPTDKIPPFIFYMSGTILWNLFANCVTKTAYTFISSASLFQKVFFPRMVIPLSQVITNFMNFAVQFCIFLVFVAIFILRGAPIHLNYQFFLLPIILLQTMLLGLGVGCIMASWTVKYRDLQMTIGFGMQLWMYGSCVFYPRSMVPDNLQWLITLNPIATILECFRDAVLGVGRINIGLWLISVAITIVVLFAGLWLFSKSEGTVIDSL